MDSYQEKRYGWRFWCLQGSLLAVAAFFAYLLHADFSAREGEGSGPPIAALERSELSVHRKFGHSFQWNPVERGAPLYRKDAIRLGEKSFAKLKFNDGKEIELDENSFIILNDDQGYGVEFVEGTAIVRDQNGEQQISAQVSGQAKKTVLKLRLVSPPVQSLYYVRRAEKKPVHFEWAGELAGKENWLELSDQRNFSGTRTQKIALAPENDKLPTERLVELPPGQYFWRLRSDGETVSRLGRFVVRSVFTGIPKSPAETVISLRDASVVPFTWTLPATAIQEDWNLEGIPTRVQVADNENFEPLLKDSPLSLSSGRTTLEGLPEGSLYWRLASQFDDIQVTSPVKEFQHELRAERPLKLDPPKIVQSNPLPESGGGPSASAPESEFRWQPEENATQYRFELKRLSDGKVIATETSSSPDAHLATPPSGNYAWRVQAFGDGGKKLAESEWSPMAVAGTLKIELTAPKPKESIFHDTQPTVFALQWKGDPKSPAASFVVKIARDALLKLGLQEYPTEKTVLASEGLKLGDETYFWRVEALDAQKVVIGVSETRSFRYGKRPELPPPKPVRLTEGPTWNVMEQKQLPTVKWEPMPGATRYEVLVKQNDQLVFRELTAKTEYGVRAPGGGDFRWTVRAIDESGRPGEFMEPKEIKVIYPRLSAPKGLRLKQVTPHQKKK